MIDLVEKLKRQIEHSGPMDVGAYMRACLCDPDFGYYIGRDPLGAAGDFTTAPEISQMFGELIGLCVADYWVRIGLPSSFVFVECGPGRGTLMADMLRATRGVDGFHEAMRLHLVEVSPVLREKQKGALSSYDVTFCDRIEDIDGDDPILLVGNEFLDALPVRQLIKHQGTWKERVVGVSDDGDDFIFGVRSCALRVDQIIPMGVLNVGEANVYEFSPERDAYVSTLCEMLKLRKGAALFIDYGEDESREGDSLHALRNHEPIDVLMAPGESDLSANVDFAAVGRVAGDAGAFVHGIVKQGEFLCSLGVQERAEVLKVASSSGQVPDDIDQALHRLIDFDQMGKMFKVIGFSYGYDAKFAGF